MKRILSYLALFVFASFLSGSVLYAYPVSGYVDPGSANGYSLSTTTKGTATYTFKNLVSLSGSSLQAITLNFEKDVFDMSQTSAVLGTLPMGWSFSSMDTGADIIQIASTQGPGIPEGSKLAFQIDYTLWYDALSLNWNEGGPWQQSFGITVAGASSGVSLPGGSTAPIPEPAAMLLFGVSLITAAGYGKHLMKR